MATKRWGGGLGRVWFATLVFAGALQGVVPMFPIYSREFGLTASDLTLVFAVYAIVLVPALLLLGPLSDVVGRKAMLVPALVLTALASIWLATVTDLSDLIVGRVLQGVAAGAFWGTSGAFARDLTPDDRRDDASLLISATFSGGIATGSIMFGGLAALTSSAMTPWVAHAAAVAVALVLVLSLPETVPERRRPSLKLRLQLPAGHERGFLLFVTPLVTAFSSLTGIALALSPSLLVEVGSGGSARSGLLVGFMLLVATAVQVATRQSIGSYRAAVGGCLLIVTGAGAVAATLQVHSVALLFAAIGLVGLGNGLAIRGTLSLAERMSHQTNRAVAVTAFTVVLYATTSAPTLASGYLAERVGLTATVLTLTALAAAAVAVALGPGRASLHPEVLADPQRARPVQVDGR